MTEDEGPPVGLLEGLSPKHRSLVLGGGVVLILGFGLLLGMLLGDAQLAAEVQDPVERFEARRTALSREVARGTPDLLGVGPLAPTQDLARWREALHTLKKEADAEGVSLDLLDMDMALLLAELEHRLKLRDRAGAEAIAARFADRPEGMILEARLDLLRGEELDVEPLRVLSEAQDPRIASAARLVLAHTLASRSPDEALELLREKVDPRQVPAARDRALLFRAAGRLSVEGMEEVLPRVREAAPRREAARAVVRQARRVAETLPVDRPRLEGALRLLVMLGAEGLGSDEAARDFARSVVTRACEGLGRAAGPKDMESDVLLLERLAASGLRAGELPLATRTIDEQTRGPAGDEQATTQRLRLLAAFAALGTRVEDIHLEGLAPEAAGRLPQDAWSDYLGARLSLLAGGDPAAPRDLLRSLAKGPRARELNPIHRARALLLGSDGLPLSEEAALMERAVGLDAGCPWVRLRWASVLARQGNPERALDEAEGAHVLFDKRRQGRPGEEEARLRLMRELALVHAQRGDEALAEVFISKLEKAGDPQHERLAAEARSVLRGE